MKNIKKLDGKRISFIFNKRDIKGTLLLTNNGQTIRLYNNVCGGFLSRIRADGYKRVFNIHITKNTNLANHTTYQKMLDSITEDNICDYEIY